MPWVVWVKSGEEGGRGKCAERLVNGGSGTCERDTSGLLLDGSGESMSV